MDRYIVALTGHRLQDLSPQQRQKAKDGLTTTLTRLKEEHGEKLLVLSGMATGVDQFGAQICCDLGIDWTACVPHENYIKYANQEGN